MATILWRRLFRSRAFFISLLLFFTFGYLTNDRQPTRTLHTFADKNTFLEQVNEEYDKNTSKIPMDRKPTGNLTPKLSNETSNYIEKDIEPNDDAYANIKKAMSIQEILEERKDDIAFQAAFQNLCPNTTRGSARAFKLYKGYYHSIEDDKSPDGRTYFMNVYYDERLKSAGTIVIRSVGTGNFTFEKRDIFATIWYPGLDYGVPRHCYVRVGPVPLGPVAQHYGFKRFTISCGLGHNDNRLIPDYVTIGIGKCSKITNLIPVVVPYSPDPQDPKKIGNCMQSLFGTFDRKFALMFVHWIESIQIYGISEVTMNVNNFTNTEFGQKVFDYYTQKGVLKVTHYPDIVSPYTKKRETITGRIQSFIWLPFVDCFFKNMYRYWYVAPLDVDEIFVLKDGSRTYQEFLNKYIALKPVNNNTIYITGETAGFYLNYGVGNKSAPDYLPLAQYTKRDEYRGPHEKTIQNPRTCEFAAFHRCRPLQESTLRCYNCGYLPVKFAQDQMVLHHYRNSCKNGISCLPKDKAIFDDIFANGPLRDDIENNVRATLRYLGEKV